TIGLDPYLSDLALGGQAAAAEAVHAQHRSRPRPPSQLVLHLLRVVGQGGDLFRGEDLRERPRAGERLSRVFADGDLLLAAGEDEAYGDEAVGSHRRMHEGLEAVRLDADGAGRRLRGAERDLAARARHRLLRP